jgi:hypothetical protein
MVTAREEAARHKRAVRARDEWNAAHPVGTPVLFWPGHRDGPLAEPGRRSQTRSAAWVMPCDEAVVLVDGYSGGIALTHVEPTGSA